MYHLAHCRDLLIIKMERYNAAANGVFENEVTYNDPKWFEIRLICNFAFSLFTFFIPRELNEALV